MRIIAATNKDLDALAKQNRFEPDLIDRLSANLVHIPPLRERPADIPVLARRFAAVYGRKNGRCTEVSDEAAMVLSHRKLAGNARELRYVVEAACDRCGGSVVTSADLPSPPKRGEHPLLYHEARKHNEMLFKRTFLTAALDRNSWNVERAAEEAGIPRQTMYRIMRELALQRPLP